jgi:hypothetical protein
MVEALAGQGHCKRPPMLVNFPFSKDVGPQCLYLGQKLLHFGGYSLTKEIANCGSNLRLRICNPKEGARVQCCISVHSPNRCNVSLKK